eukprot:CAMPEP_0196134482 /NCGR_PEP_ID=MMETSP0910-20130528/3376_1 /TAXON_ID=49265 /ORGANISM="Thalassiosira rotula, Strain GSO102" /LENGTH=552 /DNA_ID=CAMNT_0041394421 /DNA_START=327 /DNA_END=1985 /DNA_ORIENTATION=+
MADYGRIDDNNSRPEQHINYSQQSPGCVSNNNTAHLRSVAHQHFANRGNETKKPTTSSSSHVAKQQNQSAAHKHFAKKPPPSKAEAIDPAERDQALAIGRQISLLDDEDDRDNDVEFGDINKDGTESTCSESCPPSPYPAGSPSGVGHDYAAMTPEDAMALEVGHGAFEYLEECFFTEVSVLDREQFNAIPEIVKADFTITEHLGKGNFSDVFEVVWKKSRQPFGADSNHSVTPPAPNNRRRPARPRRSALSASVTTATLLPPSNGDRQSAFALKCLRPGIRSDIDQFTIGAEDLVHETAILATLDHRHIIKLHGRASGNLTDAFVMNDGYFILLDRLSETLYDRIADWKESPECTRRGPTLGQIEVAHSVADAMEYLHSKKIVFRDLKPDNVGFDSAGVLKMFDFGFAVGLPEKDESNPAGFLFDRCGTPRYMAPEVGLSLGYGLTADVYSFGIFLWELCALAKPFASITSSTEFQRAVFMGGKRPAMENHWPTAMRELMSSCWSASPSKRPINWADVKSALSSLMTDGNDNNKDQTRNVRSRDYLNAGWK